MTRKKNPLGEVFGFPTSNQSTTAQLVRETQQCPFKGEGQLCTKVNAGIRIGVCSVLSKETAVITCPYRFIEEGIIFQEACEFAFGTSKMCRIIPEVSIHNAEGKVAGNVDFVAVWLNDQKEILDFASVEIQGVYVSGNVSKPFLSFLTEPDADFDWSGKKHFPKPDYRSSQKRLIAQIRLKGEIFKSWNKKQVIVIQRAFFQTLPKVQRVEQNYSDILWIIVDLEYDSERDVYDLKIVDRAYMLFNDVLYAMGRSPAGSMNEFIKTLNKKLNF